MGADKSFVTFIGFDSREPQCSYVAAHSIKRRTNIPVDIRYLEHRKLRQEGHFNRPWLVSGEAGEWTDILDGKTFSTEFSHTRFLVPHLMDYKGWALFMDADMIFLTDIKKLLALRDDKFALMCVKHVYPPRKDEIKMDGRAQRYYQRKNWSSFVLWNCAHPSNMVLTDERVNSKSGAYLHGLGWLDDTHIGALPYSYNHISGVSPALAIGARPDVVHYSAGGPWFDSCRDVPYAEWWDEEFTHWQRHGAGNKYNDVPSTEYDV